MGLALVADVWNSGFYSDPWDCLQSWQRKTDRSHHLRLLHGLCQSSYGVLGSMLNWIVVFLFERIQQVVVAGAKSDIAKVTGVVPQGTVRSQALAIPHFHHQTAQQGQLKNSSICRWLHIERPHVKETTSSSRMIWTHLAEWDTRLKMEFHPQSATCSSAQDQGNISPLTANFGETP